MSVEIYAFLGSNAQELESRLIESLKGIGFRIGLHPEMELLRSNPTGCMSIAIFETPPTLKRLAPGVPLLTSFGYSVTQPDPSASRSHWPPKGVKKHSYEIYTRTSAGRSRSSYFMQAFTAAILAKETDGYFWVNGDAKAISGKKAFDKIVAELHGLDATALQLKELMGNIEREHGVAEANRFGRAMHDQLDAALDIGAFPFNAWPPVEKCDEFSWSAPICLPPFQGKPESLRSKISFYWTMVIVVVTAMVLVTMIYS